MATRIRANCEDCGDVELTIGDVEVKVCNTDNSGTYQFVCPLCDNDVIKPAEPRVVDLLVAHRRRRAIELLARDPGQVGQQRDALAVLDHVHAWQQVAVIGGACRGAGIGLARRMMTAVEAEARALGFTGLVLDTNGALTEAIALYRATGWHDTEPYTGFPATHWFAKPL